MVMVRVIVGSVAAIKAGTVGDFIGDFSGKQHGILQQLTRWKSRLHILVGQEAQVLVPHHHHVDPEKTSPLSPPQEPLRGNFRLQQHRRRTRSRCAERRDPMNLEKRGNSSTRPSDWPNRFICHWPFGALFLPCICVGYINLPVRACSNISSFPSLPGVACHPGRLTGQCVCAAAKKRAYANAVRNERCRGHGGSCC